MLISGYRHLTFDEPPQFVTAVISSFQDFASEGPEALPRSEAFDIFQAHYWTFAADQDLSAVFGLGQYAAVEQQDVERIQQALRAPQSPPALASMAALAIRNVRQRASHAQTIGESLMSAVVPADLQQPVWGQYMPAEAERVAYQVDQVIALPGSGLAFNQVQLRAESPDAMPLSVPVVSRNRPCPCGSPYKYKHCHGAKGRSRGREWWADNPKDGDSRARS